MTLREVVPRKPSEVPFGTYVRSWSDDDEEIFLLSDLDERNYVEEFGKLVISISEVVLVPYWLVKVPRNVAKIEITC